jgi:hypothetical protein
MRPQICFTSTHGEALHLDDIFYWHGLRITLIETLADLKQKQSVHRQLLECGYDMEDETHYRFHELATVRRIQKQFRNSQGSFYARLRARLDKRISDARNNPANTDIDPFIASIMHLHSDKEMYTLWDSETLTKLDIIEKNLNEAIHGTLPATLEDYDRYIGDTFQSINPLMQDLIQQARTDA